MPPKAKRPQVVDISDYQPISQPSVRSGYLWTPAHLRAMQLQADSGDLTRLGDLCEQMIADDRIGELLESLAGDVLGCELSFEKTPRMVVGDAEKGDELETDWPIGYDDDELTSLSIWTLVTGIGFGKHERWVENESRIVPQLKWWHPRQFTFRQPKGATQHWKRQWHVRDHDGIITPVTPGDGTWVMLTRRGEFRPWANGLWRGLAPWWLLKQYAISDWGVHSEKTSKLVVTAEEGVTSDQRKAIAKYVYEASKDAVISLPVGFDMKLIETAANTQQIYDAQIKAADEGFAIAILGQNLSSNVQGGSRAAAEVHERKENRKVRWLGKLLTKGLHDQSLSWWAEYNFGDRSLAPYPHWHTEPPEDYAAKATGLKTLADGLVSLKAAGYKLSTEDLEEDFGVELEELPDPPPEMAAGMPGKPGQPPRKAANPPAKSAKPPAKSLRAELDGLHLASGDDPAEAAGFIRGQVYVDDLSDKQTELAADALTGFVDRLSAAIDGAEDYEAVRSAVIAAFLDEQDPDRIADLVAAGIVMANMAGRNAVVEDLPADEMQASGDTDPRQLALFEAGRADQPRVPAGYGGGGRFTKGTSFGPPIVKKTGEGRGKSGGGSATKTTKAAKAPRKAAAKKSADSASKAKAAKKPAAKAEPKAKPAAKRKADPKKAADGTAKPKKPSKLDQPSPRLGKHAEEVFGKKLSERELGAIFGLKARLPKGYKAEIVHVSEDPAFGVSVHGAIQGPKGYRIAQISRYYTREGGVTSVEHASFFIDQAHQNQGLGRAMFNAQVSAYKSTGLVKNVTLSAAEHGRYVWTKAGFEWTDRAQKAQVLDRFREHLSTKVAPAAADKIMKKVKTPRDVARTVVAGERVGKALLMDYNDSIVSMSQTPDKIKRL